MTGSCFGCSRTQAAPISSITLANVATVADTGRWYRVESVTGRRTVFEVPEAFQLPAAVPGGVPRDGAVVLEILREMEERRYPLMYRTLPPSVYHVYMHPDDFREIEPIVPLIGGLYTAWAGTGAFSMILRSVVAAICLLPPTLLMGATLPAMERVFEVLAMENDKPDRADARNAPQVVDEIRFEGATVIL